MKRRITALIMTLCMVLTMMPLHVHATESEHVHDFAGSWTVNADSHWHTCVEHINGIPCNEKGDLAAHNWDSQYTISCFTCHYSKPHTHTGGTATCDRQATCQLCGFYYGDYDPTVHRRGYHEPIDANSHKVLCDCGATFMESEPHFMWEADGKTYCFYCEYEATPSHTHVWEWTYDSTLHWEKCFGCGESSTAAQAHQFDSDSDATCDTCGYTRTIEPAHVHSYTAATCTTPATCSDPTCGETKGDVDKSNHVGGTEIRNAKDATEFTDGYTGDTYCKGCGAKLSTGEVIPAMHEHFYEDANCAFPATCRCGATTGSVNKNNHIGGTEVRGRVEAEEFTPGYTGDFHCIACGDKLIEGQIIPPTHTHSYTWAYNSSTHWEKCIGCGESSSAAEGHLFDNDNDETCSKCDYVRSVHTHSYSTATCTTPATCSCGATKGSVDSTNHVGGTEIRNAKDATEFTDGYTGDAHCLGCGAKLSTGEVIPAMHEHFYEDANCAFPATCRCGATTGSVNKNNHIGGTEVRGRVEAEEFTPGYTGDFHCIACGDKLIEGQIIPPTHTHSYTWAYDSNTHWEECIGCGESSSTKEPHLFDNATDETCNKCDYTWKLAPPAFTITTESMKDALVGEAYSQSFAYDGTPSGIVFWNATGLPEGLSINAGTGVISGTPKQAGTYSVTVALGATGGGSGSKEFTLVVKEVHVCTYIWKYTDDQHWQVCIDGDSATVASSHIFENEIDGLCDICGYIREVHIHIYLPATCTTPAICDCGDISGEVDKNNHTGGTEIRDAKDASEFEAGYTGDTYCLGCGDKLADGQTLLATHVHSYTAVVTAPTCKEQGYTTYTCGCGDSYVDDYTDASGHDWGAWENMQDGSHSRICKADDSHYEVVSCSYEVTEIAASTHLLTCSECGDYEWKNHDWVSVDNEPHTAKCMVCGKESVDEHAYIIWRYDGTNHWRVCGCGQGLTGSVKAHTFGGWELDEDGHWRVCTECGYANQKKSHIYSNDSDEDCNECGYERNVHTHSYSTATCTTPATCSCGATTGSKDPTNHAGGTEIRNAKEATETENGYTGDTHCKGCGAKLTSGKRTNKLGFVDVKYDDDVVVKEVTFQPIKGVTLPDDAEVIVKNYTATIEPVAAIVGSDVEIKYITVADSDIIVSEPPIVLNGVAYYKDEIIMIDGEECLVVDADSDGLTVTSSSDSFEPTFTSSIIRAEMSKMKALLRENQKLNINGVTYDVVAVRDGISSLDVAILYYKGKPAGQYRSETGVAAFNEGYDPATLKEQRDNIFIGSVTVPEKDKGLKTRAELVADLEAAQQACDEYMHEHHELSPALAMARDKAQQALAEYDAIAQLAAKKRYNVYEIGANDISIKNASTVSGTVTQTFDIPAEFVGNENVKYIAVHDTNPYAEALAEALAKQVENFSMESAQEYLDIKALYDYDGWAEENAAGKTDRVPGIDDEDALLDDAENASDALAVQYTAKQGIVGGYEYSPMYDWGQTQLSEDGKTLIATYEVDSFSPFIVYAFVEADEPEIKEFVTQPDGTLARVVNGQPVTTHTVASGENLTIIARKYGCTVDEIVALNSGLIENPSVISVDWVLTVPAK